MQKLSPVSISFISPGRKLKSTSHTSAICSLGNLVSLLGTAPPHHTHQITHHLGHHSVAQFQKMPLTSYSMEFFRATRLYAVALIFLLDFPTDHGQSRIHVQIKHHHQGVRRPRISTASLNCSALNLMKM